MPLKVLALVAVLAGACAPASLTALPSASDSCASGTAVILVHDTTLTRGCGCAEGTGTVQAGGTFACTVNSGTTVFFYFVTTRIHHQIVFTNPPGTANPSPLIDPEDRRPARAAVYGLTLSTVGSYPFADVFNSALSGTLTVL